MTPQGHCASRVAGRAGNGGRSTIFVDELDCGERHPGFLLSVRFSGKGNLTRRMITASKIEAMDDSSWIGLNEAWQRVRWARLHWQRKIGSATTARAAAESLHLSENTYTAYERDPGEGKKSTPLTHQRAIEFGRKFKVNWAWLLTGEESPFERTDAQIRAMGLMALVDEEEQQRVADIVAAAIRQRA